MKRNLNRRLICECRCDEKLKAKTDGSTRLTYTGDTLGVVGNSLYEYVYYESMKRELKTRPLYECRYDERLKAKAEESTRLAYTMLLGELEYLKIETRLIDDMFASVMGEYVFLK
jgi:hypothetical protein